MTRNSPRERALRLEAEIARNAFSGVDASILEPHRRIGERVSGKGPDTSPCRSA